MRKRVDDLKKSFEFALSKKIEINFFGFDRREKKNWF
jgi:hypothetical protein